MLSASCIYNLRTVYVTNSKFHALPPAPGCLKHFDIWISISKPMGWHLLSDANLKKQWVTIDQDPQGLGKCFLSLPFDDLPPLASILFFQQHLPVQSAQRPSGPCPRQGQMDTERQGFPAGQATGSQGPGEPWTGPGLQPQSSKQPPGVGSFSFGERSEFQSCVFTHLKWISEPLALPRSSL